MKIRSHTGVECPEPPPRDGLRLVHRPPPLATRLAFTLVEVMVALGIFFMAVFAILGVMTNGLRGARMLQQKSVDAGMVAATLSTSNIITEGMDSGDFGDMYPGFTWTRDVYEAGTNGYYQADIIVQKPGGAMESKMSIYIFSPQSAQQNSSSRRQNSTGNRMLK